MAVNVHEKTAIESIPLTPLVDVVFLLLVFFLVATTLSEEERQLSVQLPAASEAQPLTARPREVVVNVDAAGQYYVSGEPLDLKRLEEVLAVASASNPGRASVIIRADRRCQWEFVVAVMNACNKARIRNYHVSALPTKG
jgi:biopolymer transport protein ExbD